MFGYRRSETRLGTSLGLLELIYHSTVRSIRKTHGNAVVGLLLNIFQTMLLVLTFYAMMSLLGMRSAAVRGDFLLYVMSGIFVFVTHVKTMSAVAGAEGPTGQMMKHSPMNTAVSIAAAALAALYIQVLSLAVVLFVYHVAVTPIEVEDPIGAMAMLLLAWFSGVAVGAIFMAAKPWAPDAVTVISQIYARVNMIASGKMFLANTLGAKMLAMFDWNPLFHIIDQARGFTFINYNPHYTSVAYPFYMALTFIVIGMMMEFYTRQYASVSWGARR